MVSARILCCFFLLLGLYVSICTSRISCAYYCAECPYLACPEDSEIRENPNICACCPVCIRIIAEGGSCWSNSGQTVGRPPPTVECAKGLKCNSQLICTAEPSN